MISIKTISKKMMSKRTERRKLRGWDDEKSFGPYDDI